MTARQAADPRPRLGFTVPARFAAGDPFHAGRLWDVMDVGLKAMSGVLAD